MFALYIVEQHVNLRFQHKMLMPVPIELFVVFFNLTFLFSNLKLKNIKAVFGTLFSYLLKLNEEWDVPIIGNVPKG